MLAGVIGSRWEEMVGEAGMWGRKRVSLEVGEWSDYVWEGTR